MKNTKLFISTIAILLLTTLAGFVVGNKFADSKKKIVSDAEFLFKQAISQDHDRRLKDTRPGCFEPASQRSGYQFMDGLLYYHAPQDVSEHFYFDKLPTGTYSGGVATLQCQYAPELVSHTEGSTLVVN
jgi:hypothetical protein